MVGEEVGSASREVDVSSVLWIATLAVAGPIAGTHDLSKKTQSVALTSVEGAVRVSMDASIEAPVLEVVDHRPGRTCELVIQTTKGHTSVVFGPKDKEDPRDCRADFRVRGHRSRRFLASRCRQATPSPACRPRPTHRHPWPPRLWLQPMPRPWPIPSIGPNPRLYRPTWQAS